MPVVLVELVELAANVDAAKKAIATKTQVENLMIKNLFIFGIKFNYLIFKQPSSKILFRFNKIININ